MKRNIFTLVALVGMAVLFGSCGTYISANGGYYGYDDAYGFYGDDYGYAYSPLQYEAIYLSDKMAYELGLNQAQYNAVYEINLDYLSNLTSTDDLLGSYWSRRNLDLAYVLSPAQYSAFTRINYFYQPVYFSDSHYYMGAYDKYGDIYYYERPTNVNSYKGGRNRATTSYYANRKYTGSGYSQPKVFGGRAQQNSRSNRSGNSNGSYSSSRVFGGNSSTYGSNSSRSNNSNVVFGGRSTSTSSRSNQSVKSNSSVRSSGTMGNRTFGGRSTSTTINQSQSRSYGGSSRSGSSSTVQRSQQNNKSSSTSSSKTKLSGGHR